MLELLCAVVLAAVAASAVRVLNTWAGDWHDEILTECGVSGVANRPGLATWTDSDTAEVEAYLAAAPSNAEQARGGESA